MKVKFYYDYPIDVDINTDKDVEVYIDKFNDNPIPPNGIRIIILQEVYNPSVPAVVSLYESVRTQQDKYSIVLTYCDEILRGNPKSMLFMGTTSWVRGYVPPQKKFMVSTVVGGKNNPLFPGYSLRHNLWRNKQLITNPIDFYLSGECRWAEGDYSNNKILEGSVVSLSKSPMFDSQFHIAIENISMGNMFTEKLIDCLQTKTVPIYYGCTNIGDFFNTDGILVAKTLSDIIDICNNITPVLYEEMGLAIQDNYNRSHKHCVYDEQIKNIITKLIND